MASDYQKTLTLARAWEARVRQDWHEAKMRLAALGLGIEHFGTSVRGIHLDLAAWHKILDWLEAGNG